MKKEPYQNKLDKRPYNNKKAKENKLIPRTKEEIRKSGLVHPIEFNTGKNSDV